MVDMTVETLSRNSLPSKLVTISGLSRMSVCIGGSLVMFVLSPMAIFFLDMVAPRTSAILSRIILKPTERAAGMGIMPESPIGPGIWFGFP